MHNKYIAQVFVPSKHAKRGFNYVRFNYALGAICALALGAYYLVGTTAPTVQASTCLMVSHLPASGK